MMGLYVFYDGHCPLCVRTAQQLQRLDWLGRLTLISFRLPGVLEQYGLDADCAEARLHVLYRGRFSEGIAALDLIARHLPALWFLWPWIALAHRLGFGQRLYDWIARNRWRFGPPVVCDSTRCHGRFRSM